MMFKYQLQKILLVATTMVMITSAMKCDKLILTSDTVGNNGAKTILETGRYMVTTTLYTRSNKIQSLIDRLNGASNIQYSDKSFTAILVPKDLKKVQYALLISAAYRLLDGVTVTIWAKKKNYIQLHNLCRIYLHACTTTSA